ncbi:hypothetical protein [Bacillus haynesii]|uniref:hypothetical protein n=1 Tax=Bacillus haynesii TaxID=1925021 RepID=UPI002280F595|nr:hypothetical protein [Bacillus haynesii]MCY9156353.1 hypothetical protein [Bacillus haynesii]MCY9452959.1 hypothetical protein [Bacillus haynesii]
MVVTAWVLFIFFGLIVLARIDSEGDFRQAVYISLVKIFSIFIVAIAAGVIWGGLFQ